MRKIEGSSFFGTKAQDEGLRPKKRRSFAIANRKSSNGKTSFESDRHSGFSHCMYWALHVPYTEGVIAWQSKSSAVSKCRAKLVTALFLLLLCCYV